MKIMNFVKLVVDTVSSSDRFSTQERMDAKEGKGFKKKGSIQYSAQICARRGES